jgi:hypothetical protein
MHRRQSTCTNSDPSMMEAAADLLWQQCRCPPPDRLRCRLFGSSHRKNRQGDHLGAPCLPWRRGATCCRWEPLPQPVCELRRPLGSRTLALGRAARNDHTGRRTRLAAAELRSPGRHRCSGGNAYRGHANSSDDITL